MLTDEFGNESVDLSGLGRGPEGAGETRTWELNSGAYGQNTYILLKAPGILDLDLMQLVKREQKLESEFFLRFGREVHHVGERIVVEMAPQVGLGQLLAALFGEVPARLSFVRLANLQEQLLELGVVTSDRVFVGDVPERGQEPVAFLLFPLHAGEIRLDAARAGRALPGSLGGANFCKLALRFHQGDRNVHRQPIASIFAALMPSVAFPPH